MSNKQLDGKTCEACHAYLFEDDDIVVCPDCGAPYHRDCYAALGRCALADRHGTPDAYHAAPSSPDAEKHTCAACGRQSAADSAFCPYCGIPFDEQKRPHIVPPTPVPTGLPFGVAVGGSLDPCGGVKKETDLGDGVTAEEAAAFVGIKPSYYLPRFAANKKVAFNGAAFLCPAAWFAYRKQYKWLILSLVLSLAALICMVPMYSEMAAAISKLPTDIVTRSDYYTLLMQSASDLAASVPIGSVLLYLFSLVLFAAQGILCGLFGTALYREHTLEAVKKAKEEGLSELPDLARKGGVNFFLFLLILLLCYNAEPLLTFLIKLF